MLNIHSIETFGTHEWPGIRLVIFMQGCMMKCKYCHNPDTIAIKKALEMTDEDIITTAEKQKTYFAGNWWITFSGGECLIQAKELTSTCQKLKSLGYHIVIDTNGFIFNEDVKQLLNFVDLVLLDVKHFYDEEHKALTWVSNKNVLAFADYLESIWKPFRIRHVLVPTLTDDEQHLRDLGKYFQDFKMLERLEILPYHTLWIPKWRDLQMKYELENILPPTADELLKAKCILEENLKKVLVRR